MFERALKIHQSISPCRAILIHSNEKVDAKWNTEGVFCTVLVLILGASKLYCLPYGFIISLNNHTDIFILIFYFFIVKLIAFAVAVESSSSQSSSHEFESAPRQFEFVPLLSQ